MYGVKPFLWNWSKQRFENGVESLTKDEYMARVRAEFAAEQASRTPVRGRTKRESHGNGIGWTKSGKRPGRV